MLPASAGMPLAGTTARAIAVGLLKHPGAGGFGPFNPGYPPGCDFWGTTGEFVALGGAG